MYSRHMHPGCGNSFLSAAARPLPCSCLPRRHSRWSYRYQAPLHTHAPARPPARHAWKVCLRSAHLLLLVHTCFSISQERLTDKTPGLGRQCCPQIHHEPGGGSSFRLHSVKLCRLHCTRGYGSPASRSADLRRTYPFSRCRFLWGVSSERYG